MGKVEVNNEVILIRPFVRKAKVRIVRNLIREIKILQVKRGDEKKLTKFKRRADRFREEVEAAKKIKDDDVTKFAIENTKSLYSILDDPTSDARTRVIAKFADLPEMKKRIVEFKAKFPDYEHFIGPGRKKLARLQRKAALLESKSGEQKTENVEESIVKPEKKLRNVKVSDSEDEEKDTSDGKLVADDSDQIDEEDGNDEVSEDEDEKVSEDDDEKVSEEEDEKVSEEEGEEEVSQDEEDEEVENEDNEESEEENSDEKKEDNDNEISEPSSKLKNSRRPKRERENSTSESETVVKRATVGKKISKKIPKTLKREKVKQNRIVQVGEIKVVSKEATVKRFTELLQEEDEKETLQEMKSKSKKEMVELNKEVDSFFLTADGSKEYLSVIPKKKIENENLAENEFDQNNSHQGKKFSMNKRDRSFNNTNKFEGRSKKFEGNSDKFQRRSNKFEGRSDKFEGRSDKFERRPDKFRKNNKVDGFNSASKFGSRNEKRSDETRSSEKFKNKFENKSKTREEHLHPSWAAKKKEQDALKLGFQGKKIVFDN